MRQVRGTPRRDCRATRSHGPRWCNQMIGATPTVAELQVLVQLGLFRRSVRTRAMQCRCRGRVRARRSAARAAGAGRDVCAPTGGRDQVERGPEAPQRWRSLQSFGCTTSGHGLGRRGREARAAGAWRDVCAPTRGRDRVEREPGQRGNHRDNVRCNVPAAVGFQHDGAQRERSRGATCAHRPADETNVRRSHFI